MNGTGVDSVAAHSVNFLTSDPGQGQTKIIPMRFPAYTKEGTTYVPGAVTQTSGGWYTNLTPGQAAGRSTPIVPTGSDMLPIVMPSSDARTIDPFTPSDGLNQYPNIANWGVVYTVSGVAANSSTVPLKLSIRITSPANALTLIAYKASSGRWLAANISRTSIVVRTFTIPAGTDTSLGQVTYSFSFALGLPSSGPVFQSMEISEA